QALTDEAGAARIEARFTALHQDLLRDTPALAAQAILEVADGAA
ncbi:lipid-A-disaccharide synthase, partial [Bordetella pertussis]